MTDSKVLAYMKQLPTIQTVRFNEIDSEEQLRLIFAARETLKDVYKIYGITERAVALQTLYMLEGEEEEFARLKRHGATSLNASGTSVNFNTTGTVDIAPSVQNMLSAYAKGATNTGHGTVARLI